MSYNLICDDAISGLASIKDASINSCITSPPYYNMRDYGFAKQIGKEGSPKAYIENLVNVFREVKRTLRDDGTLWLNIGDTYSKETKDNIKKKDLIGIPWMLAFALRDDGWFLRSDIIWAKPNPLPGGTLDKPISSHEYLFLLSKNDEYYYDAESTKEIATEKNKDGSYIKRLKRDVWTVPVASFRGSHFAVFPMKLIEPAILASTSEYGYCKNCGTPYKRKLEKNRYSTRPGIKNKIDNTGLANRDSGRHITESKTLGWNKQCFCDTSETKKGVVLDCFCGTGTTGIVSLKNNRDFIGIDGKKEYIEIAKNRLSLEQPIDML